jgi:uncharacterized protein (DUF1697 family)
VALTVALLRAVNVGGRKLVMSELRAMLADLGHPEARTLLQSGNLVFDAGPRAGADLEAWLEAETQTRFDLTTDYLARTAAEWAAIIAANPFPAMARDDPSHLVVMPLKSAPADGALAALRAAIVGREQAEVIGRNLYLTYPDGIGQSKLTSAVIERRLGVRGTARNWNTALKLAEIASGGRASRAE